MAHSSALFRAFLRVTLLLAAQFGALMVLVRAGGRPSLRFPSADISTWLVTAPVEHAVMVALRGIGIVGAAWMLTSTVLYLLARLAGFPRALRAVRWMTLPIVRRAVDRALALSLATSTVMGGAMPAYAHDVAAPPPPALAPPSLLASPDDGDRDPPEDEGSNEQPAEETAPAPRPSPIPKPRDIASVDETESSASVDDAEDDDPGDDAEDDDPGDDAEDDDPGDDTEHDDPGDGTEDDDPGDGTEDDDPGDDAEDDDPGDDAEDDDPEDDGHGDGDPDGDEDPAEPTEQVVHVVQAGESLWSIARDQAGSGGRDAVAAYWVELLDANPGLTDDDPDLIYPGDEITLPTR